MDIGHPILFSKVAFFINITEVTGSVNWTLIKKLNRVNIDRQKDVIIYSKISRLRWIKVNWILSLVGVVRDGNRNLITTDINLFL